MEVSDLTISLKELFGKVFGMNYYTKHQPTEKIEAIFADDLPHNNRDTFLNND